MKGARRRKVRGKKRMERWTERMNKRIKRIKSLSGPESKNKKRMKRWRKHKNKKKEDEEVDGAYEEKEQVE